MSNRRICARIHLDALKHNFDIMRSGMKPETMVCAVVKTDAYGHGAVRIASMLEHESWLWGFAVATVEEGISLREAQIRKPILILGYTFEEDYPLLIHYQLRPAVISSAMAKTLSDAACKTNETIPVHIAVDTGMTRIGFFPGDEGLRKIEEISALPGLEMEGIFTHFARADEADKDNVLRAFARFEQFIAQLEEKGIHFRIRHCANSACVLELPETHLDMVRCGITIYGIYPSDEMKRTPPLLEPVMSVHSHIADVRTVPGQTPVSYGGTYVTSGETRIATIPVGYGDGYPRMLSNQGYVLWHGIKCRILGRVCMDQMMVDVTGLEAAAGDEVTLLGTDHGETIAVEELSAISGRFPYEFVCDIGKRVPREYPV